MSEQTKIDVGGSGPPRIHAEPARSQCRRGLSDDMRKPIPQPSKIIELYPLHQGTDSRFGYTLTDVDAERLEEAITHSEEYATKMAIFASAFIAPEMRYLQLAAHKIYDELSEREKQVFEMKLKGHECMHIALALEISRSSARVYWARALSKCAKVIMSPSEV